MLKNKKGFTLMEMLVVVLIIGVLGAIAFPQYSTTIDRTRIAGNNSLLKPIADSVAQYYSFNDTAPDKLTKLPVGIPKEWSSNDDLTATSPDGNCVIQLNVTGGVPSSITMTCSRGSAEEYVLQYTYTTNTDQTLFISANTIQITASDEDRVKSLNKAVKSAGWSCENSICKIK